jgi:PAS domain S-box-containing protein
MRKTLSVSPWVSSQKFIWLGIGLGIIYWFLESWIHIIFFQEGTFLSQILTPDPHETWKRLLVICLLILFSVYAQYSINIRRRTEAALQEREKDLTSILENNPAGIMLIDAETRKISWANTNTLQMIGCQKHEVEDHICHRFICPAEKDNCPVLDTEEIFDISERSLLTSTGEALPILKSVTRLVYDGKDHLLETFFDITEQKKMERDLSLASAEMDRIFQTAAVGMRVIDREFNVLKMNKTLEQMTGVNDGDALGRKCYETFAGSMCFTEDCPLTLILSGVQTVEYSVDKKRLDGQVIPCILTATPFTEPDGKLVGIVESFQDITELKKAQSAIQREHDKLQGILSAIDEGVSIVNQDFLIEYQSNYLRNLVGDCQGKTCYQVFHQQPCQCDPCLMMEVLANDQIRQAGFETPDGRSFEKTYAPIIDIDNERKVVVLLKDVTEKKKAVKAMMHAEQLSALGELAAGVAHEINNPINGIINYAQILINNSRQGNQVFDISSRIVQEGDRIAHIVEGLLSFSKRRDEKMAIMSVEQSLSNSLALAASQLRKEQIIVQMETAETLPSIYAQPYEIEQVFINIVSNARYALNKKYPGADNNKILRVTTGMIENDDRSFVRIVFRDHGGGIPKENLPKVIHPFFTTKSERKSTGLGLSISHGIVETLNGRLTIASKEPEFTEVCVELPLVPEQRRSK